MSRRCCSKRGVVGFRGGNVGLEQHPPVDRQPASVEGLHLVRDRDVGVQVRVAGPAVPVGERGRNQAPDVDLPDALWPGPGEQGMLLDERQRVLDGGLMGPFDRGRHRRIGDRPQGRHRLHRRERQVITRNRLRPRPRIFRDLSRQLPGINRLAAMLGEEELAGPPRSAPGPGLQPAAAAPAGRPAAVLIAAMRLATSSRNGLTITINDLERRPQPGHVLEVALR